MTSYQALVAVFRQDHDPPTSEDAARLMLKLLAREGFAVVPCEPTKAITKALRVAIYAKGDGPAEAWRVGVEAAIDR